MTHTGLLSTGLTVLVLVTVFSLLDDFVAAAATEVEVVMVFSRRDENLATFWDRLLLLLAVAAVALLTLLEDWTTILAAGAPAASLGGTHLATLRAAGRFLGFCVTVLPVISFDCASMVSIRSVIRARCNQKTDRSCVLSRLSLVSAEARAEAPTTEGLQKVKYRSLLVP